MKSPHDPFSQIALHADRDYGDMIVDGEWFSGPRKTLLSMGVFEPAAPADVVPCPECGDTARVRGPIATCRMCSHRFSANDIDRRRYRLSREGLARMVEEGLRLKRHSVRNGYTCYTSQKGRTVYLVFRGDAVPKEKLLGRRDPLVLFVSAEPTPDETGRMEVASIDQLFQLLPDGRIGVNPRALEFCGSVGRPRILPSKKEAPRLLLMSRIGPAILDYARKRIDEEDTCVASGMDIYRALCERIPGLDPEREKDRKKVSRALDQLCGEDENGSIRAPLVKALRDALKKGREKEVVKAAEALADGIEHGDWDAPPPEALERSDAKFGPWGHAEEEVWPDSPFDSRAKFFDMDGDDHEDDDL